MLTKRKAQKVTEPICAFCASLWHKDKNEVCADCIFGGGDLWLNRVGAAVFSGRKDRHRHAAADHAR